MSDEVVIAERVSATPEALELIERLEAKHGPLAFYQSGGCCDGSAAMCFTKGELLESDEDLKLGAIAGAPFLIDREQYERWGRPRFVIDVAPGEAGGFSLEGAEGVHFVSRTPVLPTGADEASPSARAGRG